MTEPASLRERILKLEIQQQHQDERVEEVLRTLHKLSNSLMGLQRAISAFENQGKGVKIAIRIFLAIGGAGWLAGLASFVQQFLSSK